MSPTFQQLGRRSSDRCRRVFNPSHRLLSEDVISPRFLFFVQTSHYGSHREPQPAELPHIMHASMQLCRIATNSILLWQLLLAQHVLQIFSWLSIDRRQSRELLDPDHRALNQGNILNITFTIKFARRPK